MSEFRRYCIFGCDALVVHGIALHRFPNPVKRPDLFAAWMSAVGDKIRERDHMKIYKNKRICDQHFEPRCKTSGSRLIRSAIPVNLNRVQQSASTFVQTDHSYCQPRRESLHAGPMVDMTNLTELPVPSSSVNSENLPGSSTSGPTANYSTTVFPVPSGSSSGVAVPVQKADVKHDNYSLSTKEPSVIKRIIIPIQERITRAAVDPLPTASDLPPPNDDVIDCTMYSDHCDIEEDKLKAREEVIQVPNNFLHEDYKCNNCTLPITGFRYTCVQCVDYDLCSACEALGAHALHYVLRMPGPRPYSEIQLVLNTIRYHLGYSCEPGTLLRPEPIEVANADGLSEIKLEHEEEPDPLPSDDEMVTRPMEHTPSLDKREIYQKQKTTEKLQLEPPSTVSSDENIKSAQNPIQTVPSVVSLNAGLKESNNKDELVLSTSDDVMHDHLNKKRTNTFAKTVYTLNKDGKLIIKAPKVVTSASIRNAKPYSKEPVRLSENAGITKNDASYR